VGARDSERLGEIQNGRECIIGTLSVIVVDVDVDQPIVTARPGIHAIVSFEGIETTLTIRRRPTVYPRAFIAVTDRDEAVFDQSCISQPTTNRCPRNAGRTITFGRSNSDRGIVVLGVHLRAHPQEVLAMIPAKGVRLAPGALCNS
jgi:hypothetical protein